MGVILKIFCVFANSLVRVDGVNSKDIPLLIFSLFLFSFLSHVNRFTFPVLNSRLVGIQPKISALFLNEFVMCAAFNDLAVFDD